MKNLLKNIAPFLLGISMVLGAVFAITAVMISELLTAEGKVWLMAVGTFSLVGLIVSAAIYYKYDFEI